MVHAWHHNRVGVCVCVCVWRRWGWEGILYTDSTIGCYLLVTNVFFTRMLITWFQSVTVNGFLTSYSAHTQSKFLGEYLNWSYRWIVWLAIDIFFPCMRKIKCLSVTIYGFSTSYSVHVQYFNVRLVFGYIQSTDNWLPINLFFFQSVDNWKFSDLWRPVLRMCNEVTSFRLSETQINKGILWPMHMIAL